MVATVWVTCSSGSPTGAYLCFPSVYDIKHLTKFCGVTDSGLDDLANSLDVKSARICHKAGSDSFLTALCFSELRQGFFNGSAEKYGLAQ